MLKIKGIVALLLITVGVVYAEEQTDSIKNTSISKVVDFEGVLKTRIIFAGVDLSILTENIDHAKGDIAGQATAAFKKIPPKEYAKMQLLLKQNPMFGFAMMMTPSSGTIFVKNEVAVVKAKGLGYEIVHYHNQKKDEAYLYTGSLSELSNNITAVYQPSKGYEDIFTADKRIDATQFNISKSAQTTKISGYDCNVATYTLKTAISKAGATTPTKLVVYSSAEIPKTVNFSHPYYLPEANGIMRIDIYLENADEPTMVYEVVSVNKTSISDAILTPRKTEPLYKLTDMNYGPKVLEIMMYGVVSIDAGNKKGDDNEN